MKTAAESYEGDRHNGHRAGSFMPDPHTDEPARTTVHLTPRQLEVLELLCQGLPNKLICRRLNISPGTVKVHISSILRELGVNSRLQAVVAVRGMNLLPADSDS